MTRFQRVLRGHLFQTGAEMIRWLLVQPGAEMAPFYSGATIYEKTKKIFLLRSSSRYYQLYDTEIKQNLELRDNDGFSFR